MKDTDSGHNFAECSCSRGCCGICHGHIRICKVCEGVNHSLTSKCCGYWLDDETRQKIAKGKLNYYFGKWQTD